MADNYQYDGEIVSVVESALTQASPLALRMLLEREDQPPPPLLPLVLDDEIQVLVPLHLGTQVSIITIAILTTHISLTEFQERTTIVPRRIV